MKKELFYIRGNAERADEVKAALLEKYPDIRIDSDYTRFTQPECLYYTHNGFADYVKPSEIALMDVVTKYGTELHLPKKLRFRAGDVVVNKSSRHCYIVSDMKQDNLHISPRIASLDAFLLATPEEIKEWNKETLHPNHLHYSLSVHRIKYWFLPFDKVLVRDANFQSWTCNLFSHYDGSSKDVYICSNCWYKQCIPYNEKTAHLIGTTDDYEEEEL